MDASYITPFVASTQNVFSTMLQLPVEVGTPALRREPEPTHDISGIIGMSGDVVGSIVLSFRQEAAEAIVALLCGERLDPRSSDFADAVGELVNMVSGGAKAQFPNGRKVDISCPSVIVGKNHTVARPSDVPCVVIPCSTDCGGFVIEVALRETSEAKAPAAAAAARGV